MNNAPIAANNHSLLLRRFSSANRNFAAPLYADLRTNS
jgi:hypothetical protein